MLKQCMNFTDFQSYHMAYVIHTYFDSTAFSPLLRLVHGCLCSFLAKKGTLWVTRSRLLIFLFHFYFVAVLQTICSISWICTPIRWCILLFSTIPLSISSLSIVYCHCCLHLCIWPLIFCSLAHSLTRSLAQLLFTITTFCHCNIVCNVDNVWCSSFSCSTSILSPRCFCFAQQFPFVYFIVVYVVQFILDLLVVIPKQLKHLCTHGHDLGLFPLTVHSVFCFLSIYIYVSSSKHKITIYMVMTMTTRTTMMCTECDVWHYIKSFYSRLICGRLWCTQSSGSKLDIEHVAEAKSLAPTTTSSFMKLMEITEWSSQHQDSLDQKKRTHFISVIYAMHAFQEGQKINITDNNVNWFKVCAFFLCDCYSHPFHVFSLAMDSSATC